MASRSGIPRPISGELSVNRRVVFRFISWYYLYAFVALVSLLTRLTRLPGRGPTAFFLAVRASGGTNSLLGD